MASEFENISDYNADKLAAIENLAVEFEQRLLAVMHPDGSGYPNRARTFDHVFTRGTPRDPQTWATVAAQPLPAWVIDYQTMGKALGYLGKDVASGIIEHARQTGVKLPPRLDDPSAALTPQLIVEVIRDIAFHYFPQLAPGGAGDSH
jgi:hypothetical protein